MFVAKLLDVNPKRKEILNKSSTSNKPILYNYLRERRYIDYQKFLIMMKRMTPSSDPKFSTLDDAVYKSFFRLLSYSTNISKAHSIVAEKKDQRKNNRFNASNTYKEVDLISFLEFLKISAIEDRRSFDKKRSRIAGNIEFWNREPDKERANVNSKKSEPTTVSALLGNTNSREGIKINPKNRRPFETVSRYHLFYSQNNLSFTIVTI